MIDRMIVAVLLGLLALAHGLQCPKQKTSPGREVVCYTSVSDIEQLTNAVCRCTTLVHQGYDVRNLSTSDFASFQKSLKQMKPPLQFVISIDDPAMTLNTSGTVRRETTARLLGILKDVDGVELNITAGTKDRLVDFVKGLKDGLAKKSLDKRVFLVLPTKPEDLAKQFDLKGLSKYVDLFTIPTHYLAEEDDDYHSFHPSRLMGLFDMYNADSLIDLITGLGAPKRKILVSVPANAYKFTLKNQDSNAPGSETEERQPTVVDRKQLCDSMNNGEWTVERDEDLTAPYAFKNKTWIALEDKISISIKGKYALLRELPGLAIHNIENDFQTDCGKPLTHEIHHSFTDFKRKSRAAVLNALEDDLHQTQLTYPTKVKSSEFRVVRVVDTEGHIRAVRENTQTEFTCSRQGYFVHPKSCNRFYRCVKFNQEVEDYSVFEFDCPAGLAFDERTEVCVWPGSLPQGSPCPGSSEIAPVARVRFECPSTPGYYADPQNPRWFFACIDLGGPEMMAYEFRCPFGLIFDEHKLVCEWPWLVPGYSDGAYASTVYDNRGSTQAGGGYYTGALGGQGGVYTGTTAGVGYSGSAGVGGHSGESGQSGFSGAAGVHYSGTTASGGYSGQSGFSGAGGYTGSNVGGHGSSVGQGGTGYTGTTGSGYAGSKDSHVGTGGYSGTVTGGYGGSGKVGAGGSYGGSSGAGYSGSTNEHTGSDLGYTGATGTGQVSVGQGYAGTGTTVHSGTGGIYSGTTGTGYTGSGQSGYSGSAGGADRGYSGSTGGVHGGYSGTTGGVHGGYSGSTGGVQGEYSGSTGGVHGGYSGTTGGVHGGYSGTTGGVHGGYSGTTGGVHGGYSGSTGGVQGEYSGSTGGIHGGYSDTTGGAHGEYSGSTGGVHGGSSGTGYIAGSTTNVHGGSSTGGYEGSVGVGAGGVTSGGYAGSKGTVHGGVGGYEGTIGITAGGYAGSTTIVHGGSSTAGYEGSSGVGTGGGVTSGGYDGSTSGGHAGVGYVGTTAGGYEGGVQAGGIGTGYSTGGYTTSGIKGGQTGSSNVQFSVPGTQYTGSNLGGSQTGTGHTIIYGTRPQTGVYDSSGTIGAGIGYTGGVQGHTSGTTYVQKPYTPTINCVTNCISTATLPGQIYTGHGGSADVLSGQKGVTTTYFGSTSGQGYDQGVISDGKTTYQGGSGYTGGHYGSGSTGGLNVTFGGSQVPSIGTTYHGFGKPSVGYGVTGSPGTIITGNNIPGSVITGDSSPGTVITYGETPGAVISGSVDQGTIVTGGVQPGYVKTGTGTPGYVVSGGVKTVYTGSGSPGTAVYGTPAPGVILTGTPAPGTIVKGQPSPGIVLTGQTAPGISLTGQTAPGIVLTGPTAPGLFHHGSVDQGTVVGSTGVHIFTDSGYSQGGVSVTPAYGTKIGVSTTPATGYKINEYHDNGGRGTIKFNNGDVTTKYTENDIPDYRPTGGVIPPDTLIPGYPTDRSGQPVSTGFTKTGPTKTGITTATLGGRGTYVISTGQTRPTLKPDAIGEKAFDGNVAGFTKSSTESSIYQSTQSQDVNYVDRSKITLEPAKTGYTYPKPSIPFETGIRKPVVSSTEGGILTATTPTPFLNVEVYNSPKLFGSTVSPGLGNTYTGSTEGYYPGKVPSGFTRGPVPTSTPIVYTTGSLDGYKTTLYDAAKIPVVSTTVRPVIDSGYQTVVSSTPIPTVTVTRNQFDGGIQTGSISSQTQFDHGRRTFHESGNVQNGYVSSTTQPSIFGVTSTYTISKPRPFGPPVTVTEQPEINYGSSTSSGSEYYDSKSSFGQRVTSSGFPDSRRPQTQYLPSDSGIGVTYGKPFPDITYQQSTPTAPTGGSPTKVEISRNEVDKLVTNYNRGTTKYVPSQYDVYTPGVFGGDTSRTQTSSFSSSGPSYGSTPAPFGKTQSSFSGGYTRPTSVVSYETTAKSTAVGKAKVIVKWSDLHPLLLGKLGAECTCKGDPFSNLGGPGSKLIDSSKGKVDLANYDDSDIYVDLDKDGSYEDGDYTTYQGPTKIWPLETPAPDFSSTGSRIEGPPSSTYLPSVTPSVHAGLRGSIPPSPSASHGFSANFRSGKSLSNAASTTNSVGKGASFDRYGPGGLRDSEEVLEGATNCARPGLFRHPNFCNKFYACHWDDWKKKFTLHVFNCPVHLTFDNGAGACNWPSMGPACQDDNLLV
ncbi:uncharacterized protein LOC143361176 isoform X5 [Halictus rubicundus]|uniref:uncharacterized protein LOC143361176 isoform X5 n=1 Tax=Halictus rubicundus TaxID=77578 RepID=UPI0040366F09